MLLTIILYGLAKAIIKMSFSTLTDDREKELKENVKMLDWTMYVPQFILLLLVFVLGICMPEQIVSLLSKTVIGF